MRQAMIIFGGSGIGKTQWAATVTKPELTRIIAFEGFQPGIMPQGVEVRDVMEKYDSFNADSVDSVLTATQKELQRAAKDARAGTLRVLVIDGLNALHEAAQVLSSEKHPNSQQQRAVLEQSKLRPVMLALRRIDCLVIVTAHEASRYDKETKSEAPIGVQAGIGGGGLRDKLGSYVDDIWHMKLAGKERRFTTQGRGDGVDAKSRLKNADGSPLLKESGVSAAEAASALRIYMGWSKPAGAGSAPKPAAQAPAK